MMTMSICVDTQGACVGTSPLLEVVDRVGDQAKIAMAIVKFVVIDMINTMVWLKVGADQGVQEFTKNIGIAA